MLNYIIVYCYILFLNFFSVIFMNIKHIDSLSPCYHNVDKKSNSLQNYCNVKQNKTKTLPAISGLYLPYQ